LGSESRESVVKGIEWNFGLREKKHGAWWFPFSLFGFSRRLS